MRWLVSCDKDTIRDGPLCPALAGLSHASMVIAFDFFTPSMIFVAGCGEAILVADCMVSMPGDQRTLSAFSTIKSNGLPTPDRS